MSLFWFRKLNNGEEALFNKINVPNDAFPVCLEEENKIPGGDPIKNFGVFRSAFTLFTKCLETILPLRCFFEIIRGNLSQKHYVDIDIKLEDDPLDIPYSHTVEEKVNISDIIVKEYISAILTLRPEIQTNDILVFNSNSNSKRSYHIVIDRWYFPSATQNKEFFNECMQLIPISHRKYFDDRMYKKIQQFRLFLSTKCGKNRMKTIDSQSTWKFEGELKSNYAILKEIFYASLVTNTGGCRLIPYKYKERMENVPSRDLENKEYNAILSLFKTFKDSSNFEILGLKGTLISLKRRCPSYCEVCQRRHDSENPFLFLSFDNNLYFNCRRNDNSTLIGNIDLISSSNEEKKNIPVSEYEAPSIGYSLNITNFTDNGVINLNRTESEMKNDQSKNSNIPIIICKNPITDQVKETIQYKSNSNEIPEKEKSDFLKRVEAIKKKHHNDSKNNKRIDIRISNSYNNIAIL